MHPGINGPKFKDKPALIMAGSGDVITHQELNELSNQGAQLFRSLGLKPGDSLAFMMENHKLFFPIAFAAYRSGLKYTAISWRLQASEVEYIVKDCGAKVFITSKFLEESAKDLSSSLEGVNKFMLDGESGDFLSYEDAIRNMPNTPIEDECQGASMLYSSGTTGKPKGVSREIKISPLPYTPDEEDVGLTRVVQGLYSASEDSVYLSPAPLYHSAPMGFNTGFLALGATSIILEKFEISEINLFILSTSLLKFFNNLILFFSLILSFNNNSLEDLIAVKGFFNSWAKSVVNFSICSICVFKSFDIICICCDKIPISSDLIG